MFRRPLIMPSWLLPRVYKQLNLSCLVPKYDFHAANVRHMLTAFKQQLKLANMNLVKALHKI